MLPGEMRAARKVLGLSQKELAYFLGMTQPYLSSLETGRFPIRGQIAIALRLLQMVKEGRKQ